MTLRDRTPPPCPRIPVAYAAHDIDKWWAWNAALQVREDPKKPWGALTVRQIAKEQADEYVGIFSNLALNWRFGYQDFLRAEFRVYFSPRS